MVALVLVSHSRKLALAVRELVLQMASPDLLIAVAAGVGDNHEELGTDAVHIADVLRELRGPDGILVLMDLGSAVLSAQTALELLDEQSNIRLCSAPFVEGAIAAGVQASAEASLEAVAREAERALAPKQEQIGGNSTEPPQVEQPASHASSDWNDLVLTIHNEHGLHARPAALFVQTASRFSCDIEITNETSARGPAPARSLTSVALLQIRRGDRVRVRAKGADADTALRAIADLAHSGFGEDTSTTRTHQPAPRPQLRARDPRLSRGIAGSEGVAIGVVVALNRIQITEADEPVQDSNSEFAKLEEALSLVRARLENELRLSGVKEEISAILEAQALMLSDPVLRDKLKGIIYEKHASATKAWKHASDEIVESYRAMDDPYLRERAADFSDIAQRVLQQLSGKDQASGVCLEQPAILYTRELLPSDATSCDPAMVLGVVTREGSPSSHSSIILRTLGIPAVLGVDWLEESQIVGRRLALDGSTGQVWIDPDQETLAELRGRQQRERERRDAAVRAKFQPAVTIDGVNVQVLANVATPEDSAAAAQNRADGIGLLRTEFIFLGRTDAPSEIQQVQALRKVIAPISGPTVIRTLDIGGDKPLVILPTEKENNPFLGVRGIRLTLLYPDFFVTHLKAILQAGLDRDLWLMFPMVSIVDEVVRARELVDRAHRELNATGTAHAWPVKLGCMIEVPAAALIASQIAREVDFFSIGTNDLTQYTLAAERGSSALSSLQDALHPSVLQLIKCVVDGAKRYDRHVCVCGDAASDPVAAAAFVGLGVHCLSVRSRSVPEIKACIRSIRSDDLARITQSLLTCSDAADVRRQINKFVQQLPVSNMQ